VQSAGVAKVLTVNELAEYLRVHRSTIYRLLKRGQLPGFKIGSDWRFNIEVIDDWRMKQGASVLAEEEGNSGDGHGGRA
jgi:excisionase family DNA binding protein